MTSSTNPLTKEITMSNVQFTATQLAVLSHAVAHAAGRIEWFPDNIKGGARTKVLDGLLSRGLISRAPVIEDGVTQDRSDWNVSAAGYEALGCAQPASAPVAPGAEIAAAVAAPEATQVLADEVDAQDPTDAEVEASNVVDPELEAAVAAVEAKAATEAKARRTRDNTKQAAVIAMLKRPEGATIAQVCEITGWQQHTVRGTFAGAFKKKLGLMLTSAKTEGGERVYRIS
jgi:hypothetical protein